MKVDVTTVLTDLKGSPMDTGQVPKQIVSSALQLIAQEKFVEAGDMLGAALQRLDAATLRDVSVNALMAQYKGEDNLAGTQKVQRWMLAQKIHARNEVSLKSEEISMLKELIAKAYAPIIVGPAWALLDPDSVAQPEPEATEAADN